MGKVTSNIAVAARAAGIAMVAAHGGLGAEEPPATLAIYVNGGLEACVEGVARLKDLPYREDRSDARAQWVVKPAAGRGPGPCPAGIPRRLPLPRTVSAVDGESRTFVSDGERTTLHTFIFGAGR
jgi:hypothetical protein